MRTRERREESEDTGTTETPRHGGRDTPATQESGAEREPE